MQRQLRGAGARVGTAAAMTLLLAAAPTVPRGKETIRLDYVPGKLGGVDFSHAKHVDSHRKPDGSELRCTDCHHMADKRMRRKKRMRCTGCHPGVNEAPREIEGKQAAPIATSEESGKISQKSVIFHRYCRDACHRATELKGKKLHHCKRCHEEGVGRR